MRGLALRRWLHDIAAMLKWSLPAAALLGAAFLLAPASGAERAVPVPVPAVDVKPGKGEQVAVLAGGCFWGMEEIGRAHV